jgi:serine protease Do
MARAIMVDLMHEGRVIRGWLGVTIANLDQDLAESLGLQRPTGALVQEIDPTGAAMEAGIQPGDVIVRFDGEVVRDMPHLRNRVAMTRPGRDVEVIINRAGREQVLHATMREREDLDPEPVAAAAELAPNWVDPFGMEVTELTSDAALALDTTVGSGGLIVESVAKGGIAEQKGLRAGDILRHAGKDRVAVSSVSQYRTIVEDLLADEALLLMVERDGRTRFLALRNPS